MPFFLPRRLVDFEYLGGSGDSTDVEYDRLASQYHKDIDFAFYFVNFGTTKSEFLELTRREKAFIRKAWEDKQVRESELMRNAVLNAVSNAMRKKSAKFVDLWKRQQQPANMEIVEAHLEIINKNIADEGKYWVDLVYQANNMTKPSEGQKMADYTLGVQITGDASKMQKAFEKAQEQAEKLKEKIKDSNNESGNSFDGLTTKIDAISGKLSAYGDKISSIGKNMTTMFTLPAVAGITAVVKEYANLEQSIGGVETLFKKSAKAVQKNANTAFRRAGVSANEYMEQVTSFSASLISSLGGDTAKAVGVADTAMVDMSDNANKFGTNIGLIQNAYQGFAKGNYTMLDNLRLGFGGTKEEMQRLLDEAGKLSGMEFDINNFSDIIQAIHIIQDNLGVTGTTAREASETISGSFSQAKASVIDFMGSLGGDGSDVDAKMQAMIQSITVFADNVKEALGRIWDNLPLQEYQKNLLLIAVVGGPILVVVGTIFGAIANIMTVVSGILTVLGMMTPIGWIIAAAIAAIVAAVVFWDDIVAEVSKNLS